MNNVSWTCIHAREFHVVVIYVPIENIDVLLWIDCQNAKFTKYRDDKKNQFTDSYVYVEVIQ